MNKNRTLLILWIIYGFVFIKGIDSLLYLFIHLVYFGTSSLGLSYPVLTFIIPAITLVSYFATVLILILKINISSDTSGVLLTEFPKRQFLLLMLAAIAVLPLTNKLTELYSEYMGGYERENVSDFIAFHSWKVLGFAFARGASLAVLGLIYMRKYNLEKENN